MPEAAPALDVLCIGETMVLGTPADDAELAESETLRWTVAGAESTVAQYLSDLGHHSAWASRLGADPFGRKIRNALGSRGVRTDYVSEVDSAQTAVYFKDPSPNGTTVWYYRKHSAAAGMSTADLERFPLEDAKIVHLTGITPALSSSCRALVEALFDKAVAAGVPVSFDVNYRPRMWDRARAAEVLRELAGRAEIVLVGRDEAETLWGTETAEEAAALFGENQTVVVKDADIGASEFRAGSTTFVPAHKVEVREPVGAGDAFAAGYLSGLLHGIPARQRLERGHRLSARTLRSLDDYVPIEAGEREALLDTGEHD